MSRQSDNILIRTDRPDEAAAIVRLAELDSAPVPRAPLLVAEVDGELRAALSLANGAAVADPFHLSLELVALLKLRAAQAHGRGPRRRLRDRLLIWEQLWARARPGEAI